MDGRDLLEWVATFVRNTHAPSRTLHILDKSQDTHLFFNWFSESIQSRILNRLGEADEPDRWTWICYHQDGFVTDYRFGFRHIPFNVYPLHGPFLDESKRRIQAWTGREIDLPK